MAQTPELLVLSDTEEQKTPATQSDVLRRSNCTSASKPKGEGVNRDTKRNSWYWIRSIPDSSETQAQCKIKSLTSKGYFAVTIVLASGNGKEIRLLITVSRKGTTVLLLLSFPACFFGLCCFLSFSLTGDFGANKWPCSLLQSLNLDLPLHQKRIRLLSLPPVLMAPSAKNRPKNQRVALEITHNFPFVKGSSSIAATLGDMTGVGCSALGSPPKWGGSIPGCRTFFQHQRNIFGCRRMKINLL